MSTPLNRQRLYRALTVHQPWAWLIANGIKTIENRTWSTPHRGLLWIHASSHVDAQAVTTLSEYVALPENFTTSAIVGFTRLVDVKLSHDLELTREPNAELFLQGPYCFLLRGSQAIEPFAMPGKLRVWDCSALKPMIKSRGISLLPPVVAAVPRT